MKYKNPKLIYYYDFISCSIPRLFVYVRMQMSTSKQLLYVRSPLQKCRSIRSGASGLPSYCTPLVCISAVIELLAVWRHNKPKTKNQKTSPRVCSKKSKPETPCPQVRNSILGLQWSIGCSTSAYSSDWLGSSKPKE